MAYNHRFCLGHGDDSDGDRAELCRSSGCSLLPGSDGGMSFMRLR